jgi:hypothetical protein
MVLDAREGWIAWRRKIVDGEAGKKGSGETAGV